MEGISQHDQIGNDEPPDVSDSNTDSEEERLIKSGRNGDVISPHRAVLTLSKSMFNSGCFSLPYAWKLGGKWVALVLTIVIAGFNWYGNHILVRTSQHLAKRHGVASLDYGHFAKRVCDYSEVPILRKYSKYIMYCVNITILFYQLGMCAVAILFVSHNMVNLLGDYISHSGTLMATLTLIFITITNMFTQMRTISFFAGISAVFFLMGTGVIMFYAISLPSQWDTLSGSGTFTDTIIFVGMSMYAYEGQTMVLPVENKLEHPEEFLDYFGVLPTTYSLCTLLMFALGFYGYNAFGDKVDPSITVNIPKTGFYTVINVFLMLQSILGHSFALYVVFDMFFKGFRRKFVSRFPNVDYWYAEKGFRIFWVLVTFLMAVLIPKLEVMIPLVGVTSGTLCALVFPPLFQTIAYWSHWRTNFTPVKRALRILLNLFLIFLGLFALGAGVAASTIQILGQLAN